MTDCRLEDKLRELEMLSLSETMTDIGGRFDNKEAWYDPRTWGRSKVAPEPGSVDGTSEETDTNAHEQTNLQEEQRKLEENQRQLQEERIKLEQEQRKLEEDHRQVREEQSKIKHEKEEQLKFLHEWSSKLNAQQALQTVQEHNLEVQWSIFRKDKATFQEEAEQIKKNNIETLDRLDQLNQRLVSEREKIEQDKKKAEEMSGRILTEKEDIRAKRKEMADQQKELELRKTRMDDTVKDDALSNLKLFVRLWNVEIRDMIQFDKLRCIIPSNTTTWFIYNYYRLGDRMIDFEEWSGLEIDRKKDLRVDINRQSQRFVIFYLQSKLDKYAREKWSGNLWSALYNMHSIQDDDRDRKDERV
jgi:hypothetical protein